MFNAGQQGEEAEHSDDFLFLVGFESDDAQAESDAHHDDAKSNPSPNQDMAQGQQTRDKFHFKGPVQSVMVSDEDWGHGPSVCVKERDPRKPPRNPPPDLETPSDDDDLRGIRPIPSVIGMERDPYQRPFEPHEEPIYTMLLTRLDRNRAKSLRDQLRYHGFCTFYPTWSLKKKRAFLIEALGGVTFEYGPYNLSVAWGNREAIDEMMEKERLRTCEKRRVLLVQRDGGEVRVDGLERERHRTSSYTLTATVLNLFKDFQVASIEESDRDNGPCLVEFVRPGEAELAVSFANGKEKEIHELDLVCTLTEPSRGCPGFGQPWRQDRQE